MTHKILCATDGIVSFTEMRGYDHITMGTRDKRGTSRLVLGSVAADVAGRAHSMVTVARCSVFAA